MTTGVGMGAAIDVRDATRCSFAPGTSSAGGFRSRRRSRETAEHPPLATLRDRIADVVREMR